MMLNIPTKADICFRLRNWITYWVAMKPVCYIMLQAAQEIEIWNTRAAVRVNLSRNSLDPLDIGRVGPKGLVFFAGH
jgi:hypothetical protein